MEDNPNKRPSNEFCLNGGDEDKKGDDVLGNDANEIDETTPSSVSAEATMAKPVEISSTDPVPDLIIKNGNLPLRPIKKARTAYFIFADEKRPEIQARVRLHTTTPNPTRKIKRYTVVLLSPQLFMIFKTPYYSIPARALEASPAKLANFGLNSMRLARPNIISNRPENESAYQRNWQSTPWMDWTWDFLPLQHRT